MTAEDVMRRALVKIIIVFVLILLGLTYKAFAQSHHPPEHQALHSKFYSTWMRPDNRNISCCHDKDCAPAQSRLVNGNWQARNTDDEPWIDIPASRIERERDSPDGRSHLCKYGVTGNVQVYCFLPASGM